MKCRNCDHFLELKFTDLGFSPPSNAYLDANALSKKEIYYPLRTLVCENCWMVQTDDYASCEELFNNEYAYLSSASKSWLDHARKYSEIIIDQLKLNEKSFVVEIASNDGYLLKNFKDKKIPCLGIEPTKSTAIYAQRLGIDVIQEFFGEELVKSVAMKYPKADLIIGNNVFAHVPNINDFSKGLKLCLNIDGVISMEFPHLLQLIKNNQFDTIYHEHFSYHSLFVLVEFFKKHGLKLFDVEELNTHGGSLRIYVSHIDSKYDVSKSVDQLTVKELSFGLKSRETYINFQKNILEIKYKLLAKLLELKKDGKKVVGFGAAAKGNTLFNYFGIKKDLVELIFDNAETKQNMYTPGAHIPIIHPKHLKEIKPDYVLIIPWNLKNEIMKELDYIKAWGGKFITVIPDLSVE